MRTPARRLPLTLLLAAVAGHPLPALAVSDLATPAMGQVQCGPHTDSSGGTFLLREREAPSTTSVACSWAEGNSAGTATLEGNGLATARASGKASSSQASVIYTLMVREKAPTPFHPDFVGVKLAFRWTYQLTGPSGGTVRSSLLIPNGDGTFRVSNLIDEARRATGTPIDDVRNEVHYPILAVGTAYGMFKQSACSVGGGPSEGAGDCVTTIDPIVTLDQDRFDTKWGAQSFPLEDYYEIAYSSNFGLPVPGPESGTGGLIALVTLLALREDRSSRNR
jgi:hypothetical protein